jgi:hypothetical protein
VGRASLSREERLVKAQKQLSSMATAAAAVQGRQGFTPTSGAGNADYTASKLSSYSPTPQGSVQPGPDPFHVDEWPDYVKDGALCYKQKPTVSMAWPERYVKIEGYSLNFYDVKRPRLGSGSDDSLATVGEKRGSSIPDVSGCTVSMGTEDGYFGEWTKRNLPTVILNTPERETMQMAFEEDERAQKFHEILKDLVRAKSDLGGLPGTGATTGTAIATATGQAVANLDSARKLEDKTSIMAGNASQFADLAVQMRQQQERQPTGFLSSLFSGGAATKRRKKRRTKRRKKGPTKRRKSRQMTRKMTRKMTRRRRR